MRTRFSILAAGVLLLSTAAVAQDTSPVQTTPDPVEGQQMERMVCRFHLSNGDQVIVGLNALMLERGIADRVILVECIPASQVGIQPSGSGMRSNDGDDDSGFDMGLSPPPVVSGIT